MRLEAGAEHRLLEPRAQNGHAEGENVQDAHAQTDARRVAVRFDSLEHRPVVLGCTVRGVVRMAKVEGVLEHQPSVEGDADQDEVKIDIRPADVDFRVFFVFPFLHDVRRTKQRHRP